MTLKSRTIKTLIVDDQAVLRQPIAMALQFKGYEVMEADEGSLAWQQIQEHRPDLLLLDIGMPGMNGIDVLKEIRADGRYEKMAVMMLTAAGDKSAVVECVRLGIDDYILKSQFSLDDLYERIDRAVEKRQSAFQAKQMTETEDQALPKPEGTERSEQESTKLNVSQATFDLSSQERLLSTSDLRKAVKRFKMTLFSDTAQQIINACGDVMLDIQQLTQLVRTDQSITTIVLRIANSAAYRRSGASRSLDRAIMRIGTNGLRSVVMSMSLIDRCQGVLIKDHLSSNALWEHCFSVSFMASDLARRTGLDAEIQEQVFCMGMLHDVGRLILANAFPDQMYQVFELQRQTGLSMESIEKQLLGVTHAQLGADLLCAMGFDPQWCKIVEYHHRPHEQILSLQPAIARKIMFLQMANRLTKVQGLGDSGDDHLDDIMALLPTTGVRADDLAEAQQNTKAALSDIEAMVGGIHPQLVKDDIASLNLNLCSKVDQPEDLMYQLLKKYSEPTQPMVCYINCEAVPSSQIQVYVESILAEMRVFHDEPIPFPLLIRNSSIQDLQAQMKLEVPFLQLSLPVDRVKLLRSVREWVNRTRSAS